jgi:hypothetical protein
MQQGSLQVGLKSEKRAEQTVSEGTRGREGARPNGPATDSSRHAMSVPAEKRIK